MAANINITIKSPYGRKSVMDLNPEQMKRLVAILDGHRDMRDSFGTWFVSHIISHADERPHP